MALVLSTGCMHQHSANVEMRRLQGTWPLVYQELNGKKIPDEETAKLLNGKMAFAGDKINYSVELPGFDFQFKYKVYPYQQPKGIDLTLTYTPDGGGVGQTRFGIYRVEGDTLEICHSQTNRPTDFTAREGSHNVLIVLKRAPGST